MKSTSRILEYLYNLKKFPNILPAIQLQKLGIIQAINNKFGIKPANLFFFNP